MDGPSTRSNELNEKELKRAEEVALFRYSLIAGLVRLPAGEKGVYQRLKEISDKDYQIPGTTRTRVALETLRDWIQAYRKGGLRWAQAQTTQGPGPTSCVAKRGGGLKEKKPELSVQLVIKQAQATEKIPEDLLLAPATVNRLLSRVGLMHRDEMNETKSDRRRFAFERAGELWMSDVMHGPAVTVAEKVKRKAYLIAFLDDATRVVPHAAFTLSENTAAFLPVLKQAIMRRGVPSRLLVDNGATYRSQHLSLVCAKLGITLIHARPYQPESKGKQERWFRTARMQLLPTLNSADLSSLDALNRRLWAWVEGEYHQTPHRGLEGETPLDQWAKSSSEVHYLDGQADLDDLFLAEAKRKVQKDRTVSLNGMAFEVDASLVGATVTLRFDPNVLARGVEVWHENRKVQNAKRVDLYANCFVKRNRPSRTLTVSTPPEAPPAGLRLSELTDVDKANSPSNRKGER